MSTTPLGSLVEPEGELDECDVVRAGCMGNAGLLQIAQVFDQECTSTQSRKGAGCFRVVALVRELPARSNVLWSVVDERLPKLAGNAQQLVAVFIADADGHRHRHDAAQHGGPEGIDELFRCC